MSEEQSPSKKQKTEEPEADVEPYTPKNILLTGGAGAILWKANFARSAAEL